MRVIVVGTSGSGKSTFASALATAAACPYIELDRLYWGPGWTAVPPAQFEHAVLAATTGDRWVADGNYSAVRDVLWSRATHVVWLNFGRWTVFSRVLRRTIGRGTGLPLNSLAKFWRFSYCSGRVLSRPGHLCQSFPCQCVSPFWLREPRCR